MSQAGAANWLNGLASGNTGRYPRGSHDSFYPTAEGEENRTPPSVRRAASRRQMPSIDASPDRSSATFRSGNEALYEAYNALHSLAQDFEKPFDAPAILVVGHQTDGKSGAHAHSCSLRASTAGIEDLPLCFMCYTCSLAATRYASWALHALCITCNKRHAHLTHSCVANSAG